MAGTTTDLRIAGEAALPAVSHGEDVSALNTGFERYYDRVRGRYVRAADLIEHPGGVLLDNGVEWVGYHFLNPVRVEADENLFRACWLTPDPLTFTGSPALYFVGAGNRAEWCTAFGFYVTGPDPDDPDTPSIDMDNGGSFTLFTMDGAGSQLYRCHGYHGENIVTTAANDALIDECYLHDPQNPVLEDWALAHGTDGPHLDVVEVYGGLGVTIRKTKMTMHAEETACVNIAPFFGSVSVDDCDVEDNYFDGGNAHTLVDLQSSGFVHNVRFKRNRGGGHTNPNVIGRYAALRNSDHRGFAETLAEQAADPDLIYWPTSGADASYWANCADLAGTSDTDAAFYHGYYEDHYGVSTPGDLVPDLTGYAMNPDDNR